MQGCKKLWGGRFSDGIDPTFRDLNASISLDKRMYAEDIEGSIAYAKAIEAANLLSDGELRSIASGLEQVKAEWEKGEFVIHAEDEDIHSANERRLSEIIGDVAKKLHTGRSRNDQTITDTKLWLRKSIDVLLKNMIKFIQVLVDRAEGDIKILMPGYTHLQRAQPVRWSHWLLSYAWYAKADVERLQEIRRRANTLPLGSGAIAGNPFQIDRRFLAGELEFCGITENSMYAVGDRDFVAEFLFWSSLTAIHLSRLCEDLIIYSSEEFGFVRIADKFSTGSSLMPQKRNADCVELIRGKSGTLLGKKRKNERIVEIEGTENDKRDFYAEHFVALLSVQMATILDVWTCMGFMATLKGIPSTYNKDLQEDKEALFSTFDTINSMLIIVTEASDSLKVNGKKCAVALTSDMFATDMAYYLVRKGIPFREAHHLVGKAVALSESLQTSLCGLTVEALQRISEYFEEDVSQLWNYNDSVEQYNVAGGTSTSAVEEQISNLRIWLKQSNLI